MFARPRHAVSLALLSLALGAATEGAASSFVIPSESARRVPTERAGAAAVLRPATPSGLWNVPSPRTTGILPPLHNSVSTAGNLNGSGYSEQLVGYPNYPFGGSVEVFYRGPGGTTSQTLFEPFDSTGFGHAVTAADVNGDGFTDVIVGDPHDPQGGFERGAIYVYHGTSLGLSGSPTTSRTPAGKLGLFGYAVSYAGDVNGDGYDDVIVGAPTAAESFAAEGIAFVYHGGPGGLAANPAWTMAGGSDFAWFGLDVSTAGDVNGDGYDDVVVGAPFYTNGQGIEGRVTLFLGSSTGIQNDVAIDYESDVQDAGLGWSVSTAGDANGDGYSDWAAGAPGYTDDGQTSEGAVYFFQGAAVPFFAPGPLIEEGDVTGDNLGYDLSAGGDFNGDGLGDLFVGRPGYTDPGGDLGAVEIMLGLYDLSDWPFNGTFQGSVSGGGYGFQVAVGADVDGDGFSDLLSLDTSGALAPGGDGAAGTPVFPPTMIEVPGFSLSVLNLNTVDYLTRGPLSSGGGFSVACNGDVNGDGFDDALVGAPNYGGSGFSGLAQLFYGHADRPGIEPSPPFFSSPPDWSYSAPVNGSQLGTSVAFAGDVNGDGYDDVIVGAPQYSNGQSLEGAAFLFLGSAGGLGSAPDWKLEGNEANARYGWSVATAGDVNGDGHADVLVGAPTLSRPQTLEGAAFLYYGSPSGLAHAPARTYEGNATGYNIGLQVAGLGDIDGDGYDEFAIGAPGYTNGQVQEGAIFVYRGAPAGPGAVWDVVESNEATLGLGQAFAGAGDVNGDGRGDLIAGLPTYLGGFPIEGKAVVYHGSIGGFPSVADWSLARAGKFGTSVSRAGDLNADGFSDVLVGAPEFNSLGGQVLAYFGSATGLSTFAYHANDAFDGGLLGWSVAGGGDMNGDGYGDYLMGEPLNDLPKSFDDGATHFALSGVLQPNTIADRPIDALRPLSATAIGTGLRSDSPSSYRLNGRVRSAAGRARVRAEVESKPVGTAFNGLGLVTSPWAKAPSPAAGHPNTLLASLNVTGLAPNTKHHWRVRHATRSIYFNPSPWFSPQANAARQGDVRTAGGPGVVDTGPRSGQSSLSFAGSRPNPASFSRPATFAFALPSAGRVTLTIHDATGRLVRRLVDRDAPAGDASAPWDLRDQSQSNVAAGVYFARLAFGGEIRESKVVVLP